MLSVAPARDFASNSGREQWNIFDLRHHLGLSRTISWLNARAISKAANWFFRVFSDLSGIWPNHTVLPEMEAATAQAMARLEVTHLADRWLDELSSGEARRSLIARALIHNPGTLLLDEPTTSLDLPSLREVRQQLRNLAQSGVGLLLVTHHLDDIIPEIDRVILLKNGRVLLDGPKSEVLTSKVSPPHLAFPLRSLSAMVSSTLGNRAKRSPVTLPILPRSAAQTAP